MLTLYSIYTSKAIHHFPVFVISFAFPFSGALSLSQKPKIARVVMIMIKKHEIYKTDKWNMMTVEVQGRYIILREISDQWGEETHTFMSRPAMMQWVNNRFNKESYKDNEEEYKNIIAAFKQV
jgi:hypothetical protein